MSTDKELMPTNQPLTPQKVKPTVAPKDTPRRSSHASNPNTHSQTLEKKRALHLEDMEQEFFRIPVNEFFERYLNVQAVNDSLIGQCLERLRSDRHIIAIDAEEHWKFFPNRPSAFSEADLKKVRPESCQRLGEGAVFQGLQDLAEAIVEVARSIDPKNFGEDKQTTELRCVGHKKLNSETSGNSHLPDNWFSLRKSSVPPENLPPKNTGASEKQSPEYTADKVCYGEVKLRSSESDFKDNVRKVTYAAAHGMQDDPCRRHIFTFTIEDATTRLWFYGRSHSIQTVSFDFCKDFKTLIRTVLSFCFAPMKTLGYDSTITRIRERDDSLQYVYEIANKFYLTREWLSEWHAAPISGRATRVARVVECKDAQGNDPDESKTAVVKDVHLDVDAKSELEQQKAIFDALERFVREENSAILERMSQEEKTALLESISQGSYKNYFMHIIVDEPVTIDGVPVVTPSPPPQGDAIVLTLLNKEPRSKTPQVQGSVRSDSFSGESNVHAVEVSYVKASQVRLVAARKHRRVVFEEVCQDATSVEDFNEFLQVLEHGLQALQYLYLAGYVHRDISGGNLLSHKTDGKVQGKLSDLEYVKPFPLAPGKEHDRNPKTGTPAFMPVEVHYGKYLWQPATTVDELELIGSEAITMPVRHNYLHDIESIFWLFLWGVCNRVFVDDIPDIHKLRGLSALNINLFPYSTTCSTARLRVIEKPLYAHTELMPITSTSMRNVRKQISDVQYALSGWYQTLEQGSLLHHRPKYATCHPEMRKMISAAKPGTTRNTILVRDLLEEQEKPLKAINENDASGPPQLVQDSAAAEGKGKGKDSADVEYEGDSKEAGNTGSKQTSGGRSSKSSADTRDDAAEKGEGKGKDSTQVVKNNGTGKEDSKGAGGTVSKQVSGGRSGKSSADIRAANGRFNPNRRMGMTTRSMTKAAASQTIISETQALRISEN